MLPELLKTLLGAAGGDLVAIGEIADQASGGHLAEFLQTSQEKLDSGLAEDTRDAVLEMAKLVAYNGTQLRIVIELVAALVEKTDACAEIDRRWSTPTIDESERPELRDVVVGATSMAPAYASSTAPLRKLYVEALRGSYAPEIFTFAFGPELLEALVRAAIIPQDIEVLADLKRMGVREFNLSLTTPLQPELENCERLASGGFVEMSARGPFPGPLYIRHRTEALNPELKVRITHRGRRLLTMIAAGRGEAPS